jgi:hypothetical protein
MAIIKNKKVLKIRLVKRIKYEKFSKLTNKWPKPI